MTTPVTEDPEIEGTRVCIYIAVKSIPGDPLRRPFTLGAIFCEAHRKRAFNLDGNAQSFDDLHIPGGFDSDEDVKRWFVYDLGVQGRVDRSEYHKIVHECYRGCQLEDGNLKFVPFPYSKDKLIKYLSMYAWGCDRLPNENARTA